MGQNFKLTLSLPQTPSVGLASVSKSEHDYRMIAFVLLFVRLLCDCFKSRRRLEAEMRADACPREPLPAFLAH
jgi:hypothetical protein